MLCVLSATVDKERDIKVTYQIHGVCVGSVLGNFGNLIHLFQIFVVKLVLMVQQNMYL